MTSATLSSIFSRTGCPRKDGVSSSEADTWNAKKVFVKCSVSTETQKAEKEVRLGVLGARGYTGSEESWTVNRANLIEHKNIIIDSKSVVSGAGRGAKEANLYTEIAEGIYSYGVTRHRHVPEIEQGLSDATSSKVTVSFTPHLMPMSRGMQSTIYVELAPGLNFKDLHQHLKLSYEDEEFIVVLEEGPVPRTHNTQGSNYCFINVFPDRIPGRAIIIYVIDNLVKGASGQALQNLNVMMGFPQSTGLLYQPLFP